MTVIKQKINSKESLLEWCNQLVDFWNEHKYIQVTASDKRSLGVNALIHLWYKTIALHVGLSEDEVRAQCKYEFGRGILLRRDLELNDLLKSINWTKYADKWNISVYEAKVRTFAKYPVTSTFSTSEAQEYLEAIKNFYEPQGIHLPSFD